MGRPLSFHTGPKEIGIRIESNTRMCRRCYRTESHRSHTGRNSKRLIKDLIRISFQKNDAAVIHIHNPQPLASRSQEIHRMPQTEIESATLVFPVT